MIHDDRRQISGLQTADFQGLDLGLAEIGMGDADQHAEPASGVQHRCVHWLTQNTIT